MPTQCLSSHVLAVLTLVVALAQSAMSQDADDAWATIDALLDDGQSQILYAPQSAIDLAEEAAQMAQSHTAGQRRDTALTTSLMVQASALISLGRPHEAVAKADEALALLGENPERTKLYGKVLLAKGNGALRSSDYAMALPLLYEAHDVFDEINDPELLTKVLRDIGSVYYSSRHYERALDYYERSTNTGYSDLMSEVAATNNIAGIIHELGDPQTAIEKYEHVLTLAEGLDSDIVTGLVLYNISEVQLALGAYDVADETVQKSLTLLSAYEERGRYPKAMRARIALARGDAQEAARLFDDAFGGLDLSATISAYRDFHQDAAETYKALGDFEKAYDHLKAFKRLEDEGHNVSTAVNLVTMDAEFEFAAQQLEIERLERLALETKSQHDLQTAQYLGVGAIVIISFLITQYVILRRNQLRTERSNKSLSDANRQLEAANAAFERAENANSAKSQFLANMSHEVRTPLNGILGMAQAMSSEELSATQRDMIDTILDSGNVLMALLNDVLDLSKIEAGKMDLVLTPGDLSAALNQVCRLFVHRANDNGVSLHIATEQAELKALKFDAVRVRQCVSNLVSNAVKFTKQGTIHVTADMIEDTPGRALVSIRVKDSGIGMSKAAQHKLFSDFSQAEKRTSSDYGGTGLGLSITRRLARMMGGDVTVTSIEGQGSTFTLTIRAEIVDRATTLKPSAPAPKLHSLAGLHMLVVDDNAVNRKVAKFLLEAQGVELTEAEHGEHALEHLARSKFDLVLLDVQMPVMDGWQTIKAIRDSDQPLSKTKVIALTAEAMAGAREDLINAGMDGFIAKPIAREDALQEINRVLTNTQANHQPATPIATGGH